MEYLFTQVEYEQQGYRKGTSAKVISTGEVVLLVSNPKVEDQKKGEVLNKVGDWLDNNFENKKLIEVKLKELIKIIKTVGSNISNTELSEQSGVDSIIFGGTPISKEDVLDIGNDLIFLLVMSLVYPKTEEKITRNFCIK